MTRTEPAAGSRRCGSRKVPRARIGRVLVTGASGSGKSTLARYLRERGVSAFDADEVRGLGGPVDPRGRRLRRISKEQWRRVTGWRHFWDETVLRRFLSRRPQVVLCGAADNLFDLPTAGCSDRQLFLRASWAVIRARLDDPARDNNWGRTVEQRAWVRHSVRTWPSRARKAGYEFLDATLPLAELSRRIVEGGTFPGRAGADGGHERTRPLRLAR